PYLSPPNRALIEAMESWLEQAMTTLSTGEGDPFAPTTAYQSQTILEQLPSDADVLLFWTGKAAEQFRHDVLGPFRAVVRNQFLAVAQLHAALGAERQLWEAVRTDIDRIAENTISALDTMFDTSTKSWQGTFTVIAAVLGGVLSLGVLPPLEATALTLNVIGRSAWVPPAAPPSDPVLPYAEPRFVEISGETTSDILNSMIRASTTLRDCIDRAEAEMAGRLRQWYSAIVNDRHLFAADRPALADATLKTIDTGD